MIDETVRNGNYKFGHQPSAGIHTSALERETAPQPLLYFYPTA
jgi:hypothetical protein